MKSCSDDDIDLDWPHLLGISILVSITYTTNWVSNLKENNHCSCSYYFDAGWTFLDSQSSSSWSLIYLPPHDTHFFKIWRTLDFIMSIVVIMFVHSSLSFTIMSWEFTFTRVTGNITYIMVLKRTSYVWFWWGKVWPGHGLPTKLHNLSMASLSSTLRTSRSSGRLEKYSLTAKLCHS